MTDARTLALFLALAVPASPDEAGALRSELLLLRGQLAALEGEKLRWQEAVAALRADMKAVTEGLDGSRERGPAPVAGPFLAAPPPSSDVVGIAKVAVFAPRIEAESQRRRDLVSLRVRRVEAGTVRLLAEIDLPADQAGVDLPIDLSGALYIVEWSTSDGNVYNLYLKDGTSALPVATVQVKQLQSQGRFIFVGYRVE
jgi:hypothetical protein